jgi:hypothetical protein
MAYVASFLASHGSDTGRILALIACSVIIFYLMTSVLEDPRTKEPAKPSSFLTLEHLISRAWYNCLCYFFGGTLALAYAAVVLFSPGMIGEVKKSFVLYAEHADVPANVKDGIDSMASWIPDWADPVFVLILSLVMFAPFVRKSLVAWRDVVVSSAGLYRIADETALETAKKFLVAHSNDYKEAVKTLESKVSEVPLPEEYIGSPVTSRLAYQLLWINKAKIREKGIIDGFNAFQKQFQLVVDEAGGDQEKINMTSSVKMNMSHIFVAFVLFFVLLGLFMIGAASFANWADSHHLLWPNPQKYGWSEPVTNTIRNTLTYVVPTLLGLYMFPVRRRVYCKHESYIMSFAVVASLQWFTAFVLHELFSLLGVIRNISRHVDPSLDFSAWFLASDRQIWNFTYSIVPSIVLLLILVGREVGVPKWLSAIGITFVSGLLFLGCDYLSECAAPNFTNYYVFQGLFGMAVAACFFVVVVISEAPAALDSETSSAPEPRGAYGEGSKL